MSNKNSETTSVDISPDMKMYHLLESFPYTVQGAFNEYIDNSIDAFIKAKKINTEGLPNLLKIDLSITKDKIIIEDNGVGISSLDIQRAMKPASTPSEQSLSEYGIGMKAASLWFGEQWTLESFPIKEELGFKLNFNLEKLLSENKSSVALLRLDKDSKSGVRLTISSLNRDIELAQAERTWIEIQETYQLFTSRLDPETTVVINFKYMGQSLKKKSFSNLIVANEPLEFPECHFKDGKLYAIGPSVLWKKEIEFEFEGNAVKGFISLGTESSQKSNPGIRLFRYGRLIKGMEAKPYRPEFLLGTANKAAPSRFYAELHLDGQKISNSKGEFTFDEYLFLEELKKQEGVLQYIEQAIQYRSKKSEKGKHESFSTREKFEKQTGIRTKETKDTGSTKFGRSAVKKKKKVVIKNTAIIPLKLLSAPSSYLLLDDFIEEAIQLYSSTRMWAFCLVYRTILEVSIIDKIKSLEEEKYLQCKDKSIVAIYKFLQSNSQLIPEQFETLKRVLKENSKDNAPFVGILNIASHGRYIPTSKDVDDLLKNTQQLLEWAFDREE